mmetsp:Transcript_17857/g.56907  ORF Transcript_17857/g.56907 Transcript_17857/m.56907 type:complete len:201 (+) Transcript_17857:294-896(+)
MPVHLRQVLDHRVDVANRAVARRQKGKVLAAVQHLHKGRAVIVPGRAAVESTQADGDGDARPVTGWTAGREHVRVPQRRPSVAKLAEDILVLRRVASDLALHPAVDVLSQPHRLDALALTARLRRRAVDIAHVGKEPLANQPRPQLRVSMSQPHDVWVLGVQQQRPGCRSPRDVASFERSRGAAIAAHSEQGGEGSRGER